jgi:hypothetical protein
MAKKIRLGFEIDPPHSAIDGRFCSCDGNNHFDLVRYHSSSYAIYHRNSIDTFPTVDKPYRSSSYGDLQISPSVTSARTKGLDGRGGIAYIYNNQFGSLALKTENINEGIYLNYWHQMVSMHTLTSGSSYGGAILFSAYNGLSGTGSGTTADNYVHIFIAPNAETYESAAATFSEKRLFIYANGSILAESELLTIPNSGYVNIKISLDNTGVITGEVNGKSVSYDLKNLDWVTDGAFDMWEYLNVIGTCRGSDLVDDVAINDGSGGTDNDMPGEIKCYSASSNMQYVSEESSGITNNFNTGDTPLDEVGVLADSDSQTLLEIDKGGNLKFSIKAEDFLPGDGHGMVDPRVTDLFCYLEDVRVATADQLLISEIKDSQSNTTVSSNHYLSLTEDDYIFKNTNLDNNLVDLSDELATINLRYT